MTLKPALDGNASDQLHTYNFTKYAEDEMDKERIRIQFKHRFELPTHAAKYWAEKNPIGALLPLLPNGGAWQNDNVHWYRVDTVEKMLNYMIYNQPGCSRNENPDGSETLLPLRNLHVYFVYRFLMDRVPTPGDQTYDHTTKEKRMFELKDDIEYVVQISKNENMVANFLQSVFNTEPYKIIGTGGFSHLFKKLANKKIIINKDITIKGLIKASNLIK